MGYSGKHAYSDGRWGERPTAVPFLLLDVHDSRIATVDYRAADASGGRFFLGYEPRIYFEEPDASPPVDTHAEAEGFARWARETAGTEVDPDDVRRLMASPAGAPPAEDSVEETVEKLLVLAGLPLPAWPTDDDAPAG
ncbi:UNVERIFIED_ORG: hypothetical protein E4P37_12190 [Bacillus sp. AZ43]